MASEIETPEGTNEPFFAPHLRLLLAEAINCDDPDRAAKIIREALGLESDDVVNYCFPKEWPADRERRARYIGEWLKTGPRPADSGIDLEQARCFQSLAAGRSVHPAEI